MKRILFLCIGNSTLSQMAEVFLRRITFNRVEVFSAGVKPAPMHPMTVRVMKELGIDMTKNRSKSVNEYYHDISYQLKTIHTNSTLPLSSEDYSYQLKTTHFNLRLPI